MKIIEYKGRNYEVTETPYKHKLKDISDNEIKIHMTFSKDRQDHAEARRGWEIFWAEVLSNE